jgi:hypothetical protein
MTTSTPPHGKDPITQGWDEQGAFSQPPASFFLLAARSWVAGSSSPIPPVPFQGQRLPEVLVRWLRASEEGGNRS